MAKVGVDNSSFEFKNDGVSTQYSNFNAFPSNNQGGWVQPSAPPLSGEGTITQQPSTQQHTSFLPMPEPGPIYQPPQQPRNEFQPQTPHPAVYQPLKNTSRGSAAEPGFLPMPEPEPVIQPSYQPQPRFPQPQQSSSCVSAPQPPNFTGHGNDAPPGYYESELAQQPANRFRNDIFKSINILNSLKTQILERESRLNEFQRKSELLGGTLAGDQTFSRYQQEMINLQAFIRAAQQHLRDMGEKENLIPETGRRKMKLHLEGVSCCRTESHFYRDLCDKKPKIHIEGMCNSPDVIAQTCDNQNKHTGWIWGKQKIAIEGMRVSPKVHLKGLLINPIIHVEGMCNYPEIHLEGICLNPEIHVEGMGVHPTIRITGLCHRLRIQEEGCCTSLKINVVGICDQIETNLRGCAGVYLNVTGVCKGLRRSFGTFSPSVKFRGNDMMIRL